MHFPAKLVPKTQGILLFFWSCQELAFAQYAMFHVHWNFMQMLPFQKITMDMNTCNLGTQTQQRSRTSLMISEKKSYFNSHVLLSLAQLLWPPCLFQQGTNGGQSLILELSQLVAKELIHYFKCMVWICSSFWNLKYACAKPCFLQIG